MSYEIVLRHVPARYAAIKRFHARVEEMGMKMPAAFGDAYACRLPTRRSSRGPKSADLLSRVMWEEYWPDPQTMPPAEWRTDVIWPIVRQAEGAKA